MSAATPDPTGVRRLVAAAEKAVHMLDVYLPEAPALGRELKASAAAVRVAELERVVEAARKVPSMLGHTSHWDSTGQSGAGCPKCIENSAIVDQLRQAIAALDAGAKEGV